MNKKALGLKAKNLVLKQTKIGLKRAEMCPNCTTKYDDNASMGLVAKSKTIRVLLDSGSRGDLLFL